MRSAVSGQTEGSSRGRGRLISWHTGLQIEGPGSVTILLCTLCRARLGSPESQDPKETG